ncbi:hypothetical protein HMI54_013194 [Coelomomyces lativittatus]|nr:hypothetical protein HMI54_013194 [Coelomomyces lativittatus]
MPSSNTTTPHRTLPLRGSRQLRPSYTEDSSTSENTEEELDEDEDEDREESLVPRLDLQPSTRNVGRQRKRTSTRVSYSRRHRPTRSIQLITSSPPIYVSDQDEEEEHPQETLSSLSSSSSMDEDPVVVVHEREGSVTLPHEVEGMETLPTGSR